MADTAKLSKGLSLLDVYAIATGATLSAGLFILPGLAATTAGSAIVLCYMLAALPLVPAMLCSMELATAMPRAGDAYYFIDRSLGPLFGTVGGLGTWLALALKTSFALVGLGIYAGVKLVSAEAIVELRDGEALVFGCVEQFRIPGREVSPLSRAGCNEVSDVQGLSIGRASPRITGSLAALAGR